MYRSGTLCVYFRLMFFLDTISTNFFKVFRGKIVSLHNRMIKKRDSKMSLYDQCEAKS